MSDNIKNDIKTVFTQILKSDHKGCYKNPFIWKWNSTLRILVGGQGLHFTHHFPGVNWSLKGALGSTWFSLSKTVATFKDLRCLSCSDCFLTSLSWKCVWFTLKLLISSSYLSFSVSWPALHSYARILETGQIMEKEGFILAYGSIG